MTVVTALVGLLALVMPRAASAAAAAAPAPEADAELLSLVNGRRAALGRTTLRPDDHLAAVARSWSMEMAGTGVLDHNPNLQRQVTHAWRKLYENVGSQGTPREIFDAFVASPTHRSTIDDPDFTMIGIGSVRDAGGMLWTTHVFLQPASAGPAPAPAPAPVAPRAAAAPTTSARPPVGAGRAAGAGATAPPAPARPVPGPIQVEPAEVTAPAHPATAPATQPPPRPTADAAAPEAAAGVAAPTRTAAAGREDRSGPDGRILVLNLAVLALCGLVALRWAARTRVDAHW